MINDEGSFQGFSANTVDYLKILRENNNKRWFEANKEEYQGYLLEPLRKLVQEMSTFMLSIDAYLETSPGRAVSRIYRDTRFSYDKSPYRNTAWITFKRPGRDWQDAPAFFFEIAPDSYRYGMGFFRAGKQTMDRFRDVVDKKPEAFLKAISFYAKQELFVLEGEKYKKILNPNISEEIQEWYQRKSFYMVCNRDIDCRLFSKDLVYDLLSCFGLLAPVYHYLWMIKKSPVDYHQPNSQ